MKIKLKLAFIIYHQSWQGFDPVNKHFVLQTKKINKILKIIRKGLAMDVTMHNPGAIEEYNLKRNILQRYIHFCSNATNLQITGTPSVL